MSQLLRYPVVAILVLGGGLAMAQDKLPIPETAAQEQAAALINELFKADFEAAKTTEQKRALAQSILQIAKDSKDDPAGRYMLFSVARDIAAGAGDAETALAAIEAAAKLYEVNAIAIKTDALAAVVKSLKSQKGHQDLAPTLQAVFDETILHDRFDLAKTLNAAVLDSARQARSPDLVKQVMAQGETLAEIEAEYQKVQAAIDTLRTNATDPQANFLVGHYQCFFKGNWDQGIRMLAQGNNDTLKKLAEAELAKDSDKLSLGNAWWDFSEKAEGRVRRSAQQRAARWYSQALPGLEGLTKKLVESRLESVGDAMPMNTPEPGDKRLGSFTVVARGPQGADWTFRLVDDESRYFAVKSPGKLPVTHQGQKLLWTEGGATFTVDLDQRTVIRSRDGVVLHEAAIDRIVGEPVELLKRDSLEGWTTTEPVSVPNWTIANGILTNTTPGPSLMTKDKFMDFELHLEFLLPSKGNSGVFLRGRYEVQLLDTARNRLSNGKFVPDVTRLGAINWLIAPSKPVYAGPNRWNSMDVRLMGTTVTVVINGVTVIDNKVIERPTRNALDQNVSEPGPILLQHVDAVGHRFRNITIRPIW